MNIFNDPDNTADFNITDGIDFNKIIPEPTSKEECSTKYGNNYIDEGNKHLQHTDDKPWFDWYSWHNEFWGTKWNACSPFTKDNDEISFETAWCEPEPILEALSKMKPDEKMEVIAEYEDGWTHLTTWLNGKIISDRQQSD